MWKNFLGQKFSKKINSSTQGESKMQGMGLAAFDILAQGGMN